MTRKVFRSGIVAAAVSAVAPFAQAQTAPIVYREILSYPFFATPERATTVRSAYGSVRTGMSQAEVVTILGEPDEIRPLLRGLKAGKQIGFSYWYILRRRRAEGSQIEKDESLVRVLFDLKSRVTKIDAWGL